MSWGLYATQGLHGLVYGMLLFLVSAGLTLVFGMMGILNIAHAAFYMLGAYLAWTVVHLTGSFWLALAVAPLLVGGLGMLVERFLLRRIHAFGHAYELLLTFGLFYMVSEATRWVWGSYTLQVPMPPALAGSVPFLGGQYPVYRLCGRGSASSSARRCPTRRWSARSASTPPSCPWGSSAAAPRWPRWPA